MHGNEPKQNGDKLTSSQWRNRILRRKLAVLFVVSAMFGALAWLDRSGFFYSNQHSSPNPTETNRADGNIETSGDIEKYHNRWFSVGKSIDGDTFDIDIPDGKFHRTRIRLLGVDTPEIYWENGRIIRSRHFGREASEFTRKCTAGRMVRILLDADRTRGKHGRLLAYVELKNGKMLNRELIIQGYGFADSRSPHPRMHEFEKLMETAKSDGTGLWKNPKDLPWYVSNKR